MLVLTRHPDERIVIKVPPSNVEQKIIVQLCRLETDRVRLGFDAPVDIEILREELSCPSDASR